MKKELQIPVSIGFCKNCFRSRREGSSYCGECKDEPERMKIYQDDKVNFPRFQDVIIKMGFKIQELNGVVFTYGNTIYHDGDFTPNLLAHELTHCFQQTKMGADKWWDKYFEDNKFRVKQELEAYRQQYKVIKMNDPARAELEAVRLANDLSGRLYGWLMPFQEAMEKITK